MATTSQPSELAVLDRVSQVAAVLSPLRRRILGSLHMHPDSATGLGRRLALPRQKVNYHLRELERAGLLELAEERQRRGCIERTLRLTARAYVINPALLGDLAEDPQGIRDRFSSSFLIATATRLLREVTLLARKATQARKTLPTYTLETEIRFKNAADRADFADRLTQAVAELAARYNDESAGSRAYRLVVASHPTPAQPRGSPPSAEASPGGADAHFRNVNR
jgi:DNA-binding transcriptional ArsR family regulator